LQSQKPSRLIRTSEAAELLDVTGQTIRRYTDEGLLNYWLSPGFQRLFDKAEVVSLAQAQPGAKLARQQASAAVARAARMAKKASRDV